MGRAGKPISKNSNSKFTTRNSKQDIFSRMAKSSKPKEDAEAEKQTTEDSNASVDDQGADSHKGHN